MRKIVAEIVEIDVSDELRFGETRPRFELLPPLVETILSPAPSIDFFCARVLALIWEDWCQSPPSQTTLSSRFVAPSTVSKY
jgi:hypothetical protein